MFKRKRREEPLEQRLVCSRGSRRQKRGLGVGVLERVPKRRVDARCFFVTATTAMAKVTATVMIRNKRGSRIARKSTDVRLLVLLLWSYFANTRKKLLERCCLCCVKIACVDGVKGFLCFDTQVLGRCYC